MASGTKNPFFSVITIESFCQRLIRRIAVSSVVPIRSAISCRDGGSEICTPPSRARHRGALLAVSDGTCVWGAVTVLLCGIAM